jgi:hypothetical protein
MVDVIVLPRVVLDQLLTQKKIVPGTTVDLGQSGMGLGVRADPPKPFSRGTQARAPGRHFDCDC